MGRLQLPPRLNTLGLPAIERESGDSIGRALSALKSYVGQFGAALSLFDNIELQKETLTRNGYGGPLGRDTLDKLRILRDWQAIAARDGALTIHHFGHAKRGLHAGLRGAPTVRSMIDLSALHAARKLFNSNFPTAAEMRHATSHMEETKDTLSAIEKHGVGGGNGRRGFVYSDNLNGRSYSSMWEGKIVSYNLSQATALNMAKVRDAYFEVFGPAEKALKEAADAFRGRLMR
jgi:hypothetical protein